MRIIAAVLCLLVVCVGQTPTPTLTAVSPTITVASNFGFTVMLTGTNFSPTCRVYWQNSVSKWALATHYDSVRNITAGVPETLRVSGAVTITVQDCGTTSTGLPFVVQ